MFRRLFLVSMVPLLVCFLSEPRAEGCSYPLAHASYPSLQGDDFLDWGQIFQDAHGDYWCAIAAHDRMIEKLSATPASYWQGFLSGEFVMLAMASGLALGGRGDMTPDLDFQLKCVTERYVFAKDANCGWVKNGQPNWWRGNTCMDDYAIAASGYAWMAAYLRKSGRDWYGARWNAVDMIHQTFNTTDSVCIWNPNGQFNPLSGPCNGCDNDPPPGRGGANACHYGAQSLGTNNVQILSLNDGYQAPPYGIGLMSNIAAAFAGLEHANAAMSYYDLSDDERNIAKYIWVEGQQKSDSQGVGFLGSDCYRVDNGTGVGVFQYGYPCWDPLKVASNGQKYRPQYYPVRTFYSRYGIPMGPTGYGFDAAFPDSEFNGTEFFHAGRKETYKTLGQDWFNAPILSAGSAFRMAFRAPDYSHYMNAAGGPGSVVYATSQSPTSSDAQFLLVDLNGGQLNDGDPVGVQVYNTSYWLSAVSGGGGQVTADKTSVGSFETFTIRKLAGLFFYGAIANGDNIALQTAYGYYLHVDGAGGSTITANATSAGAYETFNYTKVDDTCQ